LNAAVWLTPTTRVSCSNAAKTRNPLKLAGVPQTPETISAASGPKFTILRFLGLGCPKLLKRSQPLVGRSLPYCGDMLRRYGCLTSFFPIVDKCVSCEDIAGQSCGMVPRWRLFSDILRPVFSASRAQHVSVLHSKFALRPHHVWMYGKHPISNH